MRRRRKTRYEWFLPTGTIGPAGDTNDDTNGRAIGLNAAANATQVVGIVDLLNDTASEETVINTGQTLSMGASTTNEYFIKRIVGKLFIGTAPTTGGADALLVGAGIFIARAGDAHDFGGAENLPIGPNTTLTQADNYSPLRLENNREPWIWRRTWVLGNKSGAAAGVATQFPTTTAGYGSIQDGSHIDAKTARRVKDGERLWLVVAARNFPLNVVSINTTGVLAYIDYRVLGAMRKSHNRSAF